MNNKQKIINYLNSLEYIDNLEITKEYERFGGRKKDFSCNTKELNISGEITESSICCNFGFGNTFEFDETSNFYKLIENTPHKKALSLPEKHLQDIINKIENF